MDARTHLERADPGHAPELTPEEARQGAKTGFMRRILTVSVVLAVIALIGAWLWTARPHPVVAQAGSPVAEAPPAPTDQPSLPQNLERATNPPTPAASRVTQPLP